MTIEAKLDQTNKLLGEILARLSAAPAAAVPATVPAAAAVPAAVPAAAAPAAAAPTTAAPTEIDYKRDIQGPLIAIAKAKGGDFARSVFAEWGVPKADKVPEADWPRLRAKIVAEVARLTADEKVKAGL